MSVLCTLDELLERLKAMPLAEENEQRPVAQQPFNDSGKLSSDVLMDKIRSGENWHSHVVQLVAHWVGRKWSDAEILATATHLTLPGYTMDQTASEIGEIISSARKKWKVSNPLQAITEPLSLVAISLSDFMRRHIPPRGMIIKPIIPTQGLAMLYATRGIGKTYVALSIALAVAAGASLFANRWITEKPRRVLFIDGEMPEITIQERLKSLSANFPSIEEDYLRIITPDQQEKGIPDLATEEGQRAIEEHLLGVELVILDNLSSLLRNGRENEADSWIPLQSWLLSLRRRGISVLIVHHAGKSGNQRGTSKREDLLDTVIHLKKSENYDPTHGAQFEVHYEKARGFFGEEAKPFDARLNSNQAGLGWEVKDIENVLLERIKVLKADGMSLRDIAAEVGTSYSSVRRLLQKEDPPPPPKQEEIKF